MVSNINAMVDMAEKSCTYFAVRRRTPALRLRTPEVAARWSHLTLRCLARPQGELHRMDMSTLPHVYSPDSAVRDVARALA